VDRSGNIALAGLVVLGIILVVGGLVLAIGGYGDGPAWVAKTIAIVVGALITLAGGQALRREPHD